MTGSFALAGGDSGLPSCTGTCSWGGGTECRQAGGPGVACSYPTWLCFFSTGQQQGPQEADSLSWSHSPVGLGFGTWTHLLPAPWLLGSPSRSLGVNPSSRKGWPPAATPHWVSRPPCRNLVRGHPASRHGLLPRARIGQEAVGVQRSHGHCPLSWWRSDLAWDSATLPGGHLHGTLGDAGCRAVPA